MQGHQQVTLPNGLTTCLDHCLLIRLIVTYTQTHVP
jgi:hypothetical protein